MIRQTTCERTGKKSRNNDEGRIILAHLEDVAVLEGEADVPARQEVVLVGQVVEHGADEVLHVAAAWQTVSERD